MSQPQPETLTNRWLVLALLAAVYAMNGADRQIIAVLAEPLRQDLDLSDRQLGMLSGVIFAVFHTTVGLPIAWFADRTNRVRIIAGAVLVWSAFTGCVGFVTNFVQLALTRIGVAIGEAGCAPPSHSLISDYFPKEQRTTALGLFALGFPLGVAAGTAAAAWITAAHGWRTAFMAMAIPGIVFGLLMLASVRHPRRGRLDAPDAGAPAVAPAFLVVLGNFLRNPVLRATTLAGTFATFTSYGVVVWMPAFLIREKGMTMLDIAQTYSVVSGSAMMLGLITSGVVVDKLARRYRSAPAVLPGVAFVLCVPFLISTFWASSWQQALAFLFVPFMLLVMWTPPTLAILQNASPPETRASTSAIFITISSIVGNSLGPLFVGLLSDSLAAPETKNSLALAMTALLPFFVVTGLTYFLVARATNRTAREQAIATVFVEKPKPV